jgi:uncharacterized protein YciI
MIFVIYCKDKPASLQLRLDTRPPHVEFLNALNTDGKLRFAGPMLGEDGKPIGSLVAIEADDTASAAEIASRDPYAKAGLFASVEIHPWNWVFNNPKA